MYKAPLYQKTLENPVFIIGLDSTTKLPYEFQLFPWDTNNGSKTPYIRIKTLPRNKFSDRFSPQEVEKRLKEITLKIREKTGGQIDIHPFYGAVRNGTKPLTEFHSFDDSSMDMFIYLGDIQKGNKPEFDILIKKWNKEFRKYNPPKIMKIPRMVLSKENVKDLIDYLEKELDFSNVKSYEDFHNLHRIFETAQ